MGYDVHITRASEWLDSPANPITLAEWREYVESDPEMRLDGFAEAHLGDGEVLRTESPGLSVWTAWPAATDETGLAWFDHHDGEIVVKGPDDFILGKMCTIAKRFNAHVQGDDGEEYDVPETHGASPAPDEPAPESPRPWWRRLFKT